MAVEFDYFYGSEAEQYAFYRIPKLLITSPMFKKVSDGAKLLYGLMLDRMCLSVKNGWVDEGNRAYIYFTTNDVMEQMNCGTEKATKMLAELDGEKGIGLIERRKQGQGKPALVYLKKFYTEDESNRKGRLSETESQDFGKSKVKTFENRNSRVSETEIQDFRKSKSNNTDNSYTEYNNTESINHIISYPNNKEEYDAAEADTVIDTIGWINERTKYKKIIKANIEYDILCERYEKEWLDEIVALMVDVVCRKEPYIRINKQDYPHDAVKSRFLSINSNHIEYIYLALRENSSNVRNIRAFLITTIYRSFETSNNWFSAKVNYDLKNGNRAGVSADE
ncbi:MAG: replication initiator protein A [Clostridia bacterium]|nr:replication initiator protein A [Clostridia bacterium]